GVIRLNSQSVVNTDPVNVGGWFMLDDTEDLSRWQIPGDDPTLTTIAPGGFLLLWADEQPGQGTLHLNFRLSSSNEAITLSGNGTEPVDQVTYGPSGQVASPPADSSGGRKSDGSPEWIIFKNPSPGTPNVFIPPVTGQILINEFMASNDTFVADEYGEYDDWIELYNSSLEPVDVGGWYITDDLAEIRKWQIPDNEPGTTTIPPGGFLLLWADEQTDQGVLHLDIKLNGNGESIGISQDGVQFVDALEYGPGGIIEAPPTDHSAGREEDAGDLWMIFEPGTSRPPTPGTTNDGGK
ncbi:MAG: lamin tail domain-containing protein, partial [Bacteroidales bacterium]